MEFPMSYAPPPPAQHSPLYNYSNTAGADSTAMAVVTGILLSTFFLLALVAFYLCKCMPGDGGSRTRAIAAKQASKGLSSDVLKRLPVVGYKELVKLRGGADSLGDCPICLSEYSVSDEKLRILTKCSHVFHVKCVDEWFSAHDWCPVCRGRPDDDIEAQKSRLQSVWGCQMVQI